MSVTTVRGRARGRAEMLSVGTVVWLASEVMFFGGLFASYFTLRAMADVWPPAGVHLALASTAVATALLVGSSGTMERAVRAYRAQDARGARWWLGATFLLGGLFLANQVREFLTLDFEISSHAYGSMYYVMTGFHGLHVLGGLLIMVALFALVGTGPVSARRVPAFESVSYYWHFVDVVWIGLFVTIFVIR